jgi:hypothetical protein
MNLAEGRGQVAVDADHEGHARNAGHGAADAAGVAHRNQDGREDAQEADAQRDRADGDGVKDAALRIEAGGGHQPENRKRAGDVHERDERARAEHGAGQRAARVAHLFAHGGDQVRAR